MVPSAQCTPLYLLYQGKDNSLSLYLKFVLSLSQLIPKLLLFFSRLWKMKLKNKGKVHPSPSSSTQSYSPSKDASSVLNLLPATILVLASILSVEDREVLAYMITRSLETTTTTTTTTDPSSIVQDSKKKCKKSSSTKIHKPPLFNCDCFDCYTCYWFRWDSSSNRELIHQAIEAFEDHLTCGEQSKKTHNARGKKKEKLPRKGVETTAGVLKMPPVEVSSEILENFEDVSGVQSPENSNDGFLMVGSEKAHEGEVLVVDKPTGELQEMAVEVTAELSRPPASNHKGLARKVLPDVLGLFNSRLWRSLWSPNV